MTDDQIRELERLLGEATPGPWKWRSVEMVGGDWGLDDVIASECRVCDSEAPVDAKDPDRRLIAAARNDLPDLLAERRKLMAVVEAARVLVAECDRHDGKLHWYEPGATDNLRDALRDLDEGGG